MIFPLCGSVHKLTSYVACFFDRLIFIEHVQQYTEDAPIEFGHRIDGFNGALDNLRRMGLNAVTGFLPAGPPDLVEIEEPEIIDRTGFSRSFDVI